MNANTLLSVYRNSKDTQGVSASLATVVQRIRDGKRGLDHKTEMSHVIAQTDKDAYRAFKETELPAVTFAGIFPKGKRKAAHIQTHSSFVVLDVDGLDTQQIPDLLVELAQHPHVRLAFISPSGAGVKIVVSVEPTPADDAEHKAAWQGCVDHFEGLADDFSFEMDPTGKDCSRLCFLAHDPQAIVNENAVAIEWDRDAYQQELEAQEAQRNTFAATNFDGDVDVAALEFIDVDDYESWLLVGIACRESGVPCAVWDAWSQQSAKYQAGVCDAKWETFSNFSGKRAAWGSVVHLAKKNGFQPQRRLQKPVKLHKRTDVSCVIEPLLKTQDQLRKAFADGKGIIGLRADTGAGKTHEAIQLYQIKGIGGFFSTPTSALAKEVARRMNTAEIDAFRWRGIYSEPDGQFPHEKPCLYPELYTAYAESGRNAYQILCTQCHALSECEDSGYRSQERKAKKAQVTVAAHKDLLFNPAFRGTAKRLLPQHAEDLIAVDEFDCFNSFLEVKVSQARLEYLRDTWSDHTLGDFAKRIISACAAEGKAYAGIKTLVESLTRTERHEITTALTSYRIGSTILDRDDAHALEVRSTFKTLNEIQALPRIETDDWNLLLQLDLFFSRYPHPETAPMAWGKNTLTFSLPPLPLYTHATVICMSATLVEDFFRRTFSHRQAKRGDVDFIDAADTQWHPDGQIFQLRTNRNPRGTLLTLERDATTGKYFTTNELSATGEHYLNLIFESIKAHPDRQHGFISYKPIMSKYEAELNDLGVFAGHFGGLVGLDAHFGRDTDAKIVLHILGSPDVPPEETPRRTALIYGDTESDLEDSRDETGKYANPKMQAVYDAGVKSELMQAIGRAGLVKNPSTVVLWTSHDLPSVSHREQTFLFDDADWEEAQGNLEKLPVIIAAREAQDAAEAAVIADGDVQAVAETKDVSTRWARHLTLNNRAEKREAERKRVFELHERGMSQRAIEKETGISRRKINKLLHER